MTSTENIADTLSADAIQVAQAIAFHVTAGGDFLTAVQLTAQDVQIDLIKKGYSWDEAKQMAVGFVADVATALGITA